MKEDELKFKDKKEEIKEQALEIYNQIQDKQKKSKINAKIDNITYYKDLTLIQPENGMGLAEQDVYVTKIIDPSVKTKFIIYNNGMQIASTDEISRILFSKEYKSQLEKIDKRFALMIEKSHGKEVLKLPMELSKDDIAFSPEELEEKNRDDKKIPQKPEGKDKEIDKVAKIAGMSSDEINSYSTIKPDQRVTDSDTFADIAGIKGKYSNIYVINASSKTINNSRFAFIGITKTGKAEYIEKLRTRGATQTDKDIYSINRDGTTVKEKQTTEMFTTKDENKMFSITKGQYGLLDVDYIRRDIGKNKFLGSPIETEHQRPTSFQVQEFMNSARTDKDELDKSVTRTQDQLQDNESHTTNLENIDNNPNNDAGYDIDEKIKMHDGTITTLRAESQKCGISPDEYVRKIEDAKGDCTSEKIQRVNDDVFEESERDERLTPAEMAELREEKHQE